jgi:hypothetical protein
MKPAPRTSHTSHTPQAGAPRRKRFQESRLEEIVQEGSIYENIGKIKVGHAERGIPANTDLFDVMKQAKGENIEGRLAALKFLTSEMDAIRETVGNRLGEDGVKGYRNMLLITGIDAFFVRGGSTPPEIEEAAKTLIKKLNHPYSPYFYKRRWKASMTVPLRVFIIGEFERFAIAAIERGNTEDARSILSMLKGRLNPSKISMVNPAVAEASRRALENCRNAAIRNREAERLSEFWEWL